MNAVARAVQAVEAWPDQLTAGWKLVLVVGTGTASALFLNERFLNFILALAALLALILYRVIRKFPRGPVHGAWDWADRNVVEIILGLVAIPNAWKLLPEIAKWFDGIP